MNKRTGSRLVAFVAALGVAVSAFATAYLPIANADSESSGLSSGRGLPEHDSSVITRYTEKEGLPTGEANTILQTSDGYIWIGSYGGLIRYDGEKFRNFSTEDLIPSSSVRSLYEDSQGRLWIGTNDKGVFLFRNDTVSQINNNSDGFLCIRDFVEGADGTIYAASTSGLATISENGELIPCTDEKLVNEPVYTIACDEFGRIWASVNSGRCLVVKDGKVVGEVESEDFTDYVSPNGDESEQLGDIYSVESGMGGMLYLGTYNHTLIEVSFLSEGLDVDKDFGVKYIDTGGIITHNNLNVSNDGSILISGISGLGVYSQLEGSFVEYDGYNNADSLNWAAADYEGNIWLASSSNGVIKLTKGCFHNHNLKAEIDGVTINAITKCSDTYYMATDTGLIICNDEWERVENELTEMLVNVRIRHIVSDGRYVWLATYSDYGAIRYDTKTGEVKSFNSEAGVLGDRTRVIELLGSGYVVVGTQLGISIISGDKVVKNYDSSNGLASIPVLSMMLLNGNLFVGTDGDGIYEITSDGKIIHHYLDEGLEDGVVLRMLPDEKDGCYFVSAGSTLYYFDGERFKELDNFAKGAGSIYDLYLKSGKLWMLQNNGIVAVYRSDLLSGETAEVRTYGVEHGLSGTLNANTHNYVDSFGNLFVSTRSGISVFGFRDVDNVVPVGIINSVSVDNEILEHPQSVTLSKNSQRITIDFSALTYTGTTPFKMAYALEGFDEQELTASGNNLLASYTNLPGGTYVFKVRIYDPMLKSTLSEYTLLIEKEKKLTEYALFWVALLAGIVLAVAVCFALIFRAKTRLYEKRKQEMQHIVDLALKTTARIIDSKDRYTNGHSIRVAYYSREIAKRMKLSEDEQKRIYSIALLHDIGKISVPDKILNKPGKLTNEEFEIIRRHVTVGSEVLEEFSVIEGIQDGAKYHHERYDGTGYCEGRAGENIPLVARIIGVADSYDAMQSDRCYRKGLPKERIIEELNNGAGAQFDPNIVKYMLELIDEEIAPLGITE